MAENNSGAPGAGHRIDPSLGASFNIYIKILKKKQKIRMMNLLQQQGYTKYLCIVAFIFSD
jgi:hypothetical protein